VSPQRILRLDGDRVTVASEVVFESESRLHRLIAAHPDVLPTEELGLGPLVAVANELDLGGGPLDLLAVDGSGRLAIIEFKRGSENSDVRRVIAQVLDYGSTLWRLRYDDLEARCRRCEPGFTDGLAEHVAKRLAELGQPFDIDGFRRGVETSLETGNFVFLYVARDLDPRTRRIMTYLADGVRMTFFAVEVGYFHAGDADSSVLVPRPAFVPSWIADAEARPDQLALEDLLAKAPPALRELLTLMDGFAAELGLEVSPSKTGRLYRAAPGQLGLGVYASGRGAEFDLKGLRRAGEETLADDLLERLSLLAGRPIRARDYPAVPPEVLTRDWERARREMIEPFFRARRPHP
jgi:hypothetical protein